MIHTFAAVLGAFDPGSINASKLLGQALRLGVLVAFVALARRSRSAPA